MSDSKHGIRLPGQLLEEIKQKESTGAYNDDRFNSNSNSKKRKEKPVSRKEKRQQERQIKKQKRQGHPHNKRSAPQPVIKKSNKKSNKIKTSTKSTKASGEEGLRIVKEDDLEDDEVSDLDDAEDEFDGFEDDHKTQKSGGLRIVKEDELDDEFSDNDDFDGFEEDGDEFSNDDDHDDDHDDDPMEKLKRLKEAKNSKSSAEDPLEQLRKIKEAKKLNKTNVVKPEENPLDQLRKIKEAKKQKNTSEKELQDTKKSIKKGEKNKKQAKEEYHRPLSARERELMERDELDMEYYAKKLGLKKGKKSDLGKQNDEDGLGSLLDGIDLNFIYSDHESGSGEEDKGISGSESESENDGDGNGYEHEENEDEFEGNEDDYGSEEFDEDELRELREMEELENSDEDIEAGDVHVIEANENPYVAPSTSTQGYVPPAIRRKMALENMGETEEVRNLRRSIKGALNKLSETNVTSIISQINDLYMNNPRQLVTEAITSIVMDSVLSQGRLLDTFLFLQASVVVAVHKYQGVEFGAYFIQTLIEKLDTNILNPDSIKESLNLMALLSAVYSFQLISSRILYDIVKLLITNLNETTAELLLKLIQSSGNQMRSDDPSALKEIILLTNKKSSEFDSVNTRMHFLIETISNLKNNKLKNHNEGSQQLIIRLKKMLGTLHGKHSDPLQVTLEDIRQVEERGKWWLVGSAWKGRDDTSSTSNHDDTADFNAANITDVLDNAEPNWVELARSQRMNTDIRRAIFISIMSANDYMDAVMKLDKLALKRSQEREIPRVILHCASVEPSWNPYYGALAGKLCDNHAFRKSLQFMLWDLVKEFDGSSKDINDSDNDEDLFDSDDVSDDDKLRRVLNLGRFFGVLIAKGALSFNVLRTVNFLTADGDTLLFLEILMVTFIDQVAKKSQTNAVGTGMKKTKMSESAYSPKLITERIAKAQEQPVLLEGLQYFLVHKLKKSSFITGKNQRARVSWGVDIMDDLISEILRSDY